MGIERVETPMPAPLVEASKNGSSRERVFERFTQSRLERAYRLAAVILRDAFEAEDAVHEAAIQAWLQWPALRDQTRMDAWFDRILVNECRARLRRRKIQPLTTNDPAKGVAPDTLSVIGDREVLHAALARLDADHRVVVVLRYVAELTPKEIAARTGDREGTVKSRLHYALREMRAALEAADRAQGGLA
jgi:RNA polymerase sigma-70 factor, ECF subfamily